jgi:hypothetical protein
MAENWSYFATEILSTPGSHWLAGNFAEILAEKQ